MGTFSKYHRYHDTESSELEFTRFPKTDAVKIDTITVRSTSLDYCYHTNNIEYVRFVLDTYFRRYVSAICGRAQERYALASMHASRIAGRCKE